MTQDGKTQEIVHRTVGQSDYFTIPLDTFATMKTPLKINVGTSVQEKTIVGL